MYLFNFFVCFYVSTITTIIYYLLLNSDATYILCIYEILVHTFRCQKDFPELKDSHRDQVQQRERFEKIQTYRLARKSVLEHHEKQMSAQQGLMWHQLEMYENMQVSETDTRFV